MSHVVMAGDINTIPVRTIAEGNGVVETVDSNVFGGGVAVGQGGSFK